MTNEEKELERFGSNGEGLIIKRNQCSNCIYNKGGLKCEKFDKKPFKYMDVQNNEKCPERKE